jgi:hypothetical protein
LIDGFLLQKMRRKDSSLMDKGGQNQTRTAKYNDSRGRDATTPVASGCTSSFEHIFDRLTGINLDDNDEETTIVPQMNESMNSENMRKAYPLRGKSYEYGTYSMTSSESRTTGNADNSTMNTSYDGVSYTTGELTKSVLDDGTMYTNGDYTENSFDDDATGSHSSGDLTSNGSDDDEFTDHDDNNSTYKSYTPGTNTVQTNASSSFVTDLNSKYSEGNSYSRYSEAISNATGATGTSSTVVRDSSS